MECPKITIDFTGKFDLSEEPIRVYTIHLMLSKNDICEALKGDYVLINQMTYHTPIMQLCENLVNNRFDMSVPYELIRKN